MCWGVEFLCSYLCVRLQAIYIFNAKEVFRSSLNWSIVTIVFHCCFKQNYSTMSRDKLGISDASDTEIKKCEVLRRQSGNIIYNVYTFLKKLQSDNEHVNTGFWKTQEPTVHACGRLYS
jgi:hypothetical protein